MSPVRNFVKAHKHEQKEINKTESFQSVINDSLIMKQRQLLMIFELLSLRESRRGTLRLRGFEAWRLSISSIVKDVWAFERNRDGNGRMDGRKENKERRPAQIKEIVRAGSREGETGGKRERKKEGTKKEGKGERGKEGKRERRQE